METFPSVCPLCGHAHDADVEFCPVCGHELAVSSADSLARILLHQIQEILESLLNPVFAFFKTLWLVVFRPVSLYQALMDGRRPIERIGFPFQFLWKWLFPDVRPYILDPLEFLLTSLVLALLLGSASEVEGVFSESAQAFNQAQNLALLNPVTSEEINLITDLSVNFMAFLLALVLLIVLLVAAAIFRLWLGWGRPRARKTLTRGTYHFWFYSMGAVMLVMLFARFLPRARGWDALPAWRFWMPVGTGVLILLLIWLFGMAPFLVFHEWGWLRTAGAVFSSWVWLGVSYGFWTTIGQALLVWPVVLFMMALLLLAALPPWLWLLCAMPGVAVSIGLLGIYREVLQHRS